MLESRHALLSSAGTLFWRSGQAESVSKRFEVPSKSGISMRVATPPTLATVASGREDTQPVDSQTPASHEASKAAGVETAKA